MEQTKTAAQLRDMQGFLGKDVRVRVTHTPGMPFEGGAICKTNYGKVIPPALKIPAAGEKAKSALPDGVFILGPRHPVHRFDGRVIALIACSNGRRYWVAAPKNSKYIIGQIRRALRFALAPEDYSIQCLYERSCGAVVFHRAAGKLYFLLIKNKRSANWGFAKGHVENHETPEQTARREVLEETGLHIRLLPGFVCRSEYVMSGRVEKSVIIFLGEAEHMQATLQASEIEAHVWAEYHRGMRILRFENDRKTLRKAYAYLRHQPGAQNEKKNRENISGSR